jgi:hypothetical protein
VWLSGTLNEKHCATWHVERKTPKVGYKMGVAADGLQHLLCMLTCWKTCMCLPFELE